MKQELICLAGQKRMGKDCVADFLASQMNTGPGITWWQRTAFASNVKEIYCRTFGVGYDFLEKWKDIDEPPPGMDMNVRKALQFIGDGFRGIKGSIWIDLMFRSEEAKIISDARYVNELIAVKERGGINILIARPDKINNDPNGSEANIKPLIEWAIFYNKMEAYPVNTWVDYDDLITPQAAKWIDLILINEGSIEDLHRKIKYSVIPYVKEYFRR